MLIGEISDRSGISTRMLRHYESVGLVVPSGRTQNGYRRYSEDDVRRLFRVEGLRALGLGLREVADVLGDASFEPGTMVERLVARTHERLSREKALLRRLEQVRTSAPADWEDVLRTIALMQGLATENPSERQRVALTSGAAAGQSIGAVAEAALSEADPNVAGALDWALAQAGDAAVPLLAEALNPSSRTRSRRAVEALSKIDSPLARDALAAAIDHPDSYVSGHAALERGRRGDPDVIPAIVELVADGRDDVHAADTLAELASSHGLADEVVDAIDAALGSASASARQRLAQSLADVTVEKADTLLTRLACDTDHHVALTAVYLWRQRHPGEQPTPHE